MKQPKTCATCLQALLNQKQPEAMKDRFRLAIHTTEDGKDLYLIYDSTQDLAVQLLSRKIKYFSNRRKAEAEAKRLNRVFTQIDEIFNERKNQK